MNLESLYREVIMDHHQHPRGRAALARVDCSAVGYNASCGDEFEVNLQIENGQIQGVQILGQGCAISQAAASMLAEVSVGLSVDQLTELIDVYRRMLQTGSTDIELPGDISALAGVSRFPVRIKCAALPVTTVLDALKRRES